MVWRVCCRASWRASAWTARRTKRPSLSIMAVRYSPPGPVRTSGILIGVLASFPIRESVDTATSSCAPNAPEMGRVECWGTRCCGCFTMTGVSRLFVRVDLSSTIGQRVRVTLGEQTPNRKSFCSVFVRWGRIGGCVIPFVGCFLTHSLALSVPYGLCRRIGSF